jgi:molybdenum cofactor biosynthesis enzyme
MSNVANNATMARIAELEAMQAELKALKQTVKNQVRMKVSAKGGISIYGLQRMPVTLYAGQWERIIDMCKSGDLGTFISDNEAILTKKVTKKTEGPTAADLAAIEAISARADRIPASDLFGDD